MSEQEKLAHRLCRDRGFRPWGFSKTHRWKWQEFLDDAYRILTER